MGEVSDDEGLTRGGLTPDNLPDWFPDLLGSLEFPLGWKESCTDPASWSTRGREAFRGLLLEDATPVDPGLQVEETEVRDGYEVRRVSLRLGRFRRTPAFLAVPEGPGPFPAALLLHDHGAFFDIGKEKMILPPAKDSRRPVAEKWMENNYGGRSVGDELARRGWVVLAADALGWGDRICGGYESQQAVASNLFNLGSSWAGVIAVEDQAAAAFLSSLPEVDSSRVVAVGHSMGAFRSWQVAALSDRITACAAVCSFGTTEALMAPGGNRLRGQSAFAMTHPGLSRLMDFPDVAALAAPKPMYMIHGRDDRLFPEQGIRDAYAKVAAVYRAWGCENRFRAEIRAGGHVFSAIDQDLVYSWMDQSR